LDIEVFHSLLEEVAAEIPEEILRDLNGGIMVMPEAKLHPGDRDHSLYVLGEYNVQIPGLGRYVALYYGSFERVFGARLSGRSARLREEIRKTLLHELRHHLESLSGVHDLEYVDASNIAAYNRRVKWQANTTASAEPDVALETEASADPQGQ
jgi:hypothetical protein